MPHPFRSDLAMATVALLLGAMLTGCAPDYSPNTYAGAAAQQANKVDQGIIVGVRAIQISADTTLATASGGAAGAVAGSTIGGGATSALGAVGGTVAGGVVGNVIGHASGDTNGFEYIVKKSNGGDLLSVTQTDPAPLGIGAHVLIIEGAQARVVPDYTVPIVVEALHPEADKPAVAANAPATASATPATSPQPAPPVSPATTAVITTPLPAPQPAPAQAAALPVAPAQPAAVEQKPAPAPDAAPAAKPDEAAAKPASGS